MPARLIHFVSLGCPKNRVDSEVMLGLSEREGFEHTADPSAADVIVVNTCGFIESARQESIETILELGRHRTEGRCSKLVVAGCLSQKHGPELATELPEVDHFLGSSDMPKIARVLGEGAPRMLIGNPAEWVIQASDPRRISTRGASAYVKIAEGCNRRCSFCVIPQLRGTQRSREAFDVVQEVEALVKAGVLEINLVSQDTVSYGRDLREPGSRESNGLADLVRRVAEVPGVRWVRLFYLYPEALTDELVDLLAHHPRVLPYVDMPLQHAAPGMLRRMRRGHGGKQLVDLVERLRAKVPNLVFRTAFIVGHPGETEQEFQALLDFVEWARFDRVGVFRYSDETTAHSFTLPGKVTASVAKKRADRLMQLQREISREKNAELVGQRVEVLVEGPSEDHDWVMTGRWQGQAPDIDGQVFISGGPVHPGNIYAGTVEQATEYDLVVDVGELDEAQPHATSEQAPKPAAITSPALLQRHTDGRVVLRTV